MKIKMKVLAFLTMTLFVLQGLYGAKCLIITGQNNHDWASTSDALSHILNLTGKIDVEIKSNLDEITEADFKDINFIILNWNNFNYGKTGGKKDMPAQLVASIENFVKNGGGAITIHAGGSVVGASDSFRHIAIGNWGGKTTHGPYGTFTVNVVKEHEITKGLTQFMTCDELWVNTEITGDVEVLTEGVLSVDMAEKIGRESKSSNEQSVVHSKYGKGRCVYIPLGHDANAMLYFGFRTLFINSAFWLSDIKSEGLYMKNIDIDKAFAEIETIASFGNLSLLNDMEMLFSQLDSKSREKMLAKISALTDEDKYSVTVTTWAYRVVDSYGFKSVASKGEKAKVKSQDLKALLAKGDKLSEDEKMLALGSFARNKFLPALDFAKANAFAENKSLAMHAISALPALASDKDYPFFEELYKKYGSDPAMMRYVTEAFLSVNAGKFDVIAKINSCDEETMPMYAMLGHSLQAKGLDEALVGKIRTAKSENCVKDLLTVFLLTSDKDTVKKLVSLYGINNARDAALTRAIATFVGTNSESDAETLAVFANADTATQAKILPALSVSNSKEIFNEVMKLLSGENKVAAKNTLKRWRDVSVLTELANVPESLRGDANEIAAGLIVPLKELTDDQVALIEKMLSYNAENTDVLKKSFDIVNVPVTKSAPPRGDLNHAIGAKAESIFNHGIDGNGGQPSAAIDGERDTYWDESDHKEKYGIRIILPEAKEISQIRIEGFAHENYAPAGFDVVLDGNNVMKVHRAIYNHGKFFLDIPKTKAQTIEIIIDKVYGPSPAIRELEIY